MKKISYHILLIIIIFLFSLFLTACQKDYTHTELNTNSDLLIDLGTSEDNLGDVSKFTKNDYEGLSLESGYYLTDIENDITYKISGLTSNKKLRMVTEISTTSDKISFYGMKVGMPLEEVSAVLETMKNDGYSIIISDNEKEYECEKDDIQLIIRLSYESNIWSLEAAFMDAVDIRVMID